MKARPLYIEKKEVEMHKNQLQALIEYHTKAEKAYRKIGDLKKAEQARRDRERFEKELKSGNAK